MRHLAFIAGLAGFFALAPLAHAERKTVCTITVNSADEKNTFRERLPKGEYEFVELVEKGRPDWLRSSCQKKVQCDVLIVSGHFNAGDTFYSDRLDRNEYLEIDELERASCSASCPTLFSRLKEVYLFGCESLNPDATRYASSHGESGRDRMRRLFPNVPSIYGFSSAAPVGPTAAMLLNRHFDHGARGSFGSGRPNAGLLKVFSRNSMVRVAGVRDGEPLAAERQRICRFFDERQSSAQKLAFVHGILRGESGELRASFSRVEKLFAGLEERERQSPGFSQALARISADDAARARYLPVMRSSPPALRARMIALGGTLGWLSDAQQREEVIAMVDAMLAGGAVGFAEVDLVCSLNADRELDREARGARLPAGRAGATAHAALMACLGSGEAHAQMLHALASADEKDVRLAQAYLRHRPLGSADELRGVAREIARTPGTGPARVRALDTLARMHISDREILVDLSRAFAESRSLNVQRAIAEVFLRSDPKALPGRDLVAVLREHRLRPPGGRHDLIDTLIARLQATS